MGNALPDLNRNIRAEMARSGIRQEALARHLGLSQSALSRRLNGTADWSIGEVVEVAAHLGCTTSYLLGQSAA